ncbi:MAG: MFS transporter, partial [Actinomycetota bacterium]
MRRNPAPADTERGITPLAFAYVAFGAFWGAIAIIFVDFLARHDLSAGTAGWYFTLTSLAAITVMAFIAPRMQHLPRRLTIPLALVAESAGAILLATLSNAWLPLAFIVVGIGTGLIDVLINAVAYENEHRSERAVLQWVHASYGTGTGLGALGAGLAMTNHSTIGSVLIAAGLALLVAAGVCAGSRSLGAAGPRERSETRVSLSAFKLHPRLLVPALIVACSFFIEGSMDVWAGAYVGATLGGTYMVTGFAVAAFGFALATGRGFAAKLLFGLGYRRTIVISGFASIVAATAAMLAPTPLVAGAAFLV